MMEKWTIPGPNISPKLNLLHVLMQPNTYVASNLKKTLSHSFLHFIIGTAAARRNREFNTNWQSYLTEDLAKNLVDSQFFSRNLAKSQLILTKNLVKVLAKILAELQPK